MFKANLTVEMCHQFSFDNAKDIIACGFKPEKTFIFSNLDFVGYDEKKKHLTSFTNTSAFTCIYRGPFYHNVVRISRCITLSQSKATFGFQDR